MTLVSNACMASMRPWLGDFTLVEVPASNCWTERDVLEPLIIEACHPPGVVLFACSMPAKVWMRRAWDSRCQATLVDVGSVFDPYIGKMSRGYMREGRAMIAEPIYG